MTQVKTTLANLAMCCGQSSILLLQIWTSNFHITNQSFRQSATLSHKLSQKLVHCTSLSRSFHLQQYRCVENCRDPIWIILVPNFIILHRQKMLTSPAGIKSKAEGAVPFQSRGIHASTVNSPRHCSKAHQNHRSPPVPGSSANQSRESVNAVKDG